MATVKPANISRAPSKKRGNRKKNRPFTYKDVLADIFPLRNDKPAEALRKCVFLITISVFSLCLFYIFDYYSDSKINNDLYAELADAYGGGDFSPASKKPSAAKEGDPEWKIPLMTLPNAVKMLQINPDYVGFIQIEGTEVQYPVVQRRGGLGDGNTYYLDHAFDGSYANAGTVFIDWRVNFDVSENNFRSVKNSENIVIYGHEMKDGQMFGTLKRYKDNYNWYGQHPVIRLDSLYRQYKYKIFAVCIVNTKETSGPVFDYFNTFELDDEAAFYDYVNQCKRRSYILNGVDVKYGDELLTLSTCNGMFEDARLIVVGRLLRDGEDELEGTQNSSRNKNVLMPDIYYRINGGQYNWDNFTPYG